MSRLVRDGSRKPRRPRGETARNRPPDPPGDPRLLGLAFDADAIAALAHELRAPLNAILGWTSLLKQRPDPDTTRRAVEVIERNARAQAALLGDLVDVSRAASGRLMVVPRPVDLVAMVQASLDGLESISRARRVTLERELGPPTCIVHADAERLQRAIRALLQHATRATAANGRVRVSVDATAGEGVLSVTGSWRAPTPGRLAQIFEQAFRWPEPSSGIGLELVMARHLVEAQGGRVEARTRGEHSTVTLRLPCRTSAAAADEAMAASPGRVTPAPTPSLAGLRILVLEDHEDTREVTAHALTERGAEISAFGSADEALVAVRSWRPDLLLVDIAMPVVDGYEFVRRVRGLGEEHRRVPAVALTAFAGAEDRDRALREGFDLHVAKPLETDQLVRAIRDLLASTADPGE